MISERAAGRLINYKFEQARRYALQDPEINDLTDHERGVIEALAAMYGNVGWFEGVQAVVIDAALRSLIGGHDEVPELPEPSPPGVP